MEWDQWIFHKLWTYFKAPSSIPPENPERWNHFANLAFGYCKPVRFVSDPGGFGATEIALPGLYLFFRLYRNNRKLQSKLSEKDLIHHIEELYRFRILFASHALESEIKDLEKIMCSLIVAYPGLYSIKSKILTMLSLFSLESQYLTGRFLDNDSSINISNANELSNTLTDSENAGAEKSIHAATEVQELTVNQEEIENYTLNHNFEKIETIEEFEGNWRDMESDDIEENADAIDELQFNQIIRSTETPGGYLTADFSGAGAPEISSETHFGEFLYDEWDYKKRRFKKEHCSVSEVIVKSAGGSQERLSILLYENRRTFLQMQRDFARLLNRSRPSGNEKDGEDFDLDAMVDFEIDCLSGRTPGERVYIKKNRSLTDIDLLILFDISLSTDSFRNQIKVLDAEKKSILLFGQVLHEYGVPFQVAAFSSKTRHHCYYYWIRNQDDSWATAVDRILSLEASGYTRIGPALRHATDCMMQNTRPFILLLTDGKPNDYDRYEGRYGMEDVRHSILEARQKGTGVYFLSFDDTATLITNQSAPIADITSLPGALMSFYSSVLYGRFSYR